MMVRWLRLSPHCKVLGSNLLPVWSLFSPCLCASVHIVQLPVKLTGDSQLSIGVSVNGCLSSVLAVRQTSPVRCVPLPLSPHQLGKDPGLTRDPECICKSKYYYQSIIFKWSNLQIHQDNQILISSIVQSNSGCSLSKYLSYNFVMVRFTWSISHEDYVCVISLFRQKLIYHASLKNAIYSALLSRCLTLCLFFLLIKTASGIIRQIFDFHLLV